MRSRYSQRCISERQKGVLGAQRGGPASLGPPKCNAATRLIWRGFQAAAPQTPTATPAATVAQQHRASEGAAPIWGDILGAAPRSGLVRPDINAKPGVILRIGSQRTVSPAITAFALASPPAMIKAEAAGSRRSAYANGVSIHF